MKDPLIRGAPLAIEAFSILQIIVIFFLLYMFLLFESSSAVDSIKAFHFLLLVDLLYSSLCILLASYVFTLVFYEHYENFIDCCVLIHSCGMTVFHIIISCLFRIIN